MPVYAEVQGSTLIRFPYTEGSLQEDNPYTRFPAGFDLATVFAKTALAVENGYTLAGVRYLEEPAHDARIEKAVQNTAPHLQDGEWVLGWTVSTRSQEEVAAADAAKSSEVRADRNTRLTACDWTQVADAPVDKTAWATYRQALRDVPSQSGFPWNVTWPSEPQ